MLPTYVASCSSKTNERELERFPFLYRFRKTKASLQCENQSEHLKEWAEKKLASELVSNLGSRMAILLMMGHLKSGGLVQADPSPPYTLSPIFPMPTHNSSMSPIAWVWGNASVCSVFCSFGASMGFRSS